MDQIGPSAEEPVGGWASSAGDFVKRAPAHAHAAPRKRAACYVVTLTFNRPRTYIPSSLRLGATPWRNHRRRSNPMLLLFVRRRSRMKNLVNGAKL